MFLKLGGLSAVAILAVLVFLTGCGGRPDPQAVDDSPPPAGSEAAPPASQDDPVRRGAEALAQEIYTALAAGDTRPLEARLDPGGCEVMVEAADPADSPYYSLAEPGSAFDWQPLLDWAKARPADTIREVAAEISPHDPRYILVSLRLEGGYFYLGLAEGVSVTKVFAQTDPILWD